LDNHPHLASLEKLHKELAEARERKGDKKKDSKDSKHKTESVKEITTASSSTFVKISSKRDPVSSPSLSLVASAQATDDAKV
jgi:ribosomal protein S25